MDMCSKVVLLDRLPLSGLRSLRYGLGHERHHILHSSALHPRKRVQIPGAHEWYGLLPWLIRKDQHTNCMRLVLALLNALLFCIHSFLPELVCFSLHFYQIDPCGHVRTFSFDDPGISGRVSTYPLRHDHSVLSNTTTVLTATHTHISGRPGQLDCVLSADTCTRAHFMFRRLYVHRS